MGLGLGVGNVDRIGVWHKGGSCEWAWGLE